MPCKSAVPDGVCGLSWGMAQVYADPIFGQACSVCAGARSRYVFGCPAPEHNGARGATTTGSVRESRRHSAWIAWIESVRAADSVAGRGGVSTVGGLKISHKTVDSQPLHQRLRPRAVGQGDRAAPWRTDRAVRKEPRGDARVGPVERTRTQRESAPTLPCAVPLPVVGPYLVLPNPRCPALIHAVIIDSLTRLPTASTDA